MPTAAPLDPETEHTLCVRWAHHGDRAARDRLVQAHQPLVQRVARRYGRSAVAVADLAQEGNLGLLYALERFDPDRGVRLAAYAGWWIRAFALRYVENNYRLIRGATTTNRTRLFYQLARTRQVLAASGEPVSRSAIAEALGVDESDVDAMELLCRPTVSLDAIVGDPDGAPTTRLDRLADGRPTPEESTNRDELRARLDDALASFERGLSGHQLEMFRDRISSDRPVSLQELGERWGMTRKAARRVEDQVTRPLRRHLYRTIGDSIAATLGAA